MKRRAPIPMRHAPGAPGDRDESPPVQGLRRLLYVINDLEVGGAQRVLVGQAKHLDLSRLRIEVASLEIDAGGIFIPELESAGIRVHRLRMRGEAPQRAWPRLLSVMRRFEPDLVHTHLAAAGILARTAARLSTRSHLVATLHNLSDWEENRLHPLRWLDRLTLSWCDRIIPVSGAVRDALLRSMPGLGARVTTVWNGVELERVHGDPSVRARARTTLGYGPEEFVVGAVARLEACKGLDTLIRAASIAGATHPELRVLLVGDGSERKRLQALARQGGIEDRVRMVGSRENIREYLAAMDLFAAPSRTEGLGLAILEGLAAGVPALGSRVGGIPEAIVHGVCGELLPPDQPILWSDRIAHYAGHREELVPMAEAARRHASRFSIEESCRQLHTIYDELLADPVRERRRAA